MTNYNNEYVLELVDKVHRLEKESAHWKECYLYLLNTTTEFINTEKEASVRQLAEMKKTDNLVYCIGIPIGFVGLFWMFMNFWITVIC